MVGGDGIAKQRHDASPLHSMGSWGFFCICLGQCQREVLKKRRLSNVGARGPRVSGPCHAFDFFPQLPWLGFDFLVIGAKGFAVHGELHQGLNFFAARPDVTQVHIFATLALPHRLGHQIFEHGARNCIGHNQGWAGQEIGFDVGVNACLKITVARKHCRAYQIVACNGLVKLRRQIARVTNTGGATVAHQSKA